VRRPRTVLTRMAWCALGLVWSAAVAAGFGVLLQYSSSPGVAGEAPERWPSASALARDGERFTLLVFAHPRCPCTAATVEQIDRLLARVRERVRVEVLFCLPPDQAVAWAHTDLWEKAAAIPGVVVRVDPDGREAARFGALTSGQA